MLKSWKSPVTEVIKRVRVSKVMTAALNWHISLCENCKLPTCTFWCPALGVILWNKAQIWRCFYVEYIKWVESEFSSTFHSVNESIEFDQVYLSPVIPQDGLYHVYAQITWSGRQCKDGQMWYVLSHFSSLFLMNVNLSKGYNVYLYLRLCFLMQCRLRVSDKNWLIF